ncbi:MAG: NAD/NADP octopine/nopaline dehydrogenase family protein [Azospirillaceae bacterium]
MAETGPLCLVGGGAVAHALAAMAGAAGQAEIRVLTRRPAVWSGTVRAVYRETLVLDGAIDRVGAEAGELVPGAGLVLIAAPAFAWEPLLRAVAPHLSPGAAVGIAGGGCGFDWLARGLLGPAHPVFALQLCPVNARLREPGREVAVAGVRGTVGLAADPPSSAPGLAARVSAVLGLTVEPLSHPLEVTLAPGNAAFHGARLYGLFGPGAPPVRPGTGFYADWDDRSSEIYLALDAELGALRRATGLPLAGARPVTERLGVATASEMTAVIRAIPSLQGIPAPAAPARSGEPACRADPGHRFFREDIPHGLAVLRAVADLLDVRVPVIDRVLRWGEALVGLDLVTARGVDGGDTRHLPLPARAGIVDRTGLIGAAAAIASDERAGPGLAAAGRPA